MRIGIFIDLTRGRDRALLRGIAAFARQRPTWTLLLRPDALSYTWTDDALSEFDALIVRVRDADLDQWLAAKKMPAVNVSDLLSVKRLPYVGTDDECVGEVAGEHLLGLGYRSIGFCGNVAHWQAKCRLAGLTRKMRTVNLVSPSVFSLDTDAVRGRVETDDALAKWLGSLVRPAAVLAVSDKVALQLAEVCRTHDIKVPEDVAILGVNNDPLLCELARPTLSSVDIGAEQIGLDAAATLDAWLVTGVRPRHRLRPPPVPRVVARDSTGIPADLDPRIASALAYIRTNAAQGVAVRHVLEHVAASRTTIERGLKQRIGRSIHDEILHQRLLYAQRLLVDTDLSMAEIAARSGYSTQQRFSVAFRAATGKTPTAFRRRR